jgi:hypothetical protein
MTRAAASAWVLWLVSVAAAGAQSAAVEVQQTVGVSSEDVGAAGTQLRVFGEPLRGLRYIVEGAWGDRSEEGSDAFGTAYPYSGDLEFIEVYGEYLFSGVPGLLSVKGGRYRTPFGIYSASDQAYIGFLRAPLIRYGEYFGLSNGYLEHGVDVVLGVPRFAVELSVGQPGDVGEAIRRDGVDTVVRAQAAFGAFVVGASYIDTMPYMPERFAKGRAQFGGVDVRWMRAGVQLRGEWLAGQPFDGSETTGGYVDAIVHVPAMGPVTALARAERLDYDTAPPRALYTHRYWGGARVRIWRGLAGSIGVGHQGGQMTQSKRTAVDAGIGMVLRVAARRP